MQTRCLTDYTLGRAVHDRSTRHHSPILTSYTIAYAMHFSFLLPPDILYQPLNRPRSTMSLMAVLQTIYGLTARHFPSQIVSQIDPHLQCNHKNTRT